MVVEIVEIKDPSGTTSQNKMNIFRAFLMIIIAAVLASGIGLAIWFGKPCSPATDYDDEVETSDSIIFEADKPWTYHRLPKTIMPRDYIISIEPNFYSEDENSFEGSVQIIASVAEATRFVILNAGEMSISDVSIEYLNESALSNGPIKLERHFLFEHYQYLVLELRQKLIKESFISVRVKFNGTMEADAFGLFKGNFVERSSKNKLFVAMTQFEPDGARYAFPCFDEPGFKAHFTISIRHRKSFRALSNMPVDVTVPDPTDPKYVTTIFRRTNVPMSTYLLAYVVGEYESLPALRTTSGCEISVFAPKEELQKTAYALETAVRMFNWIEAYFNFTHPLPKVDLIVYPDQYAVAMENWGLVSFTESMLLTTTDDNSDWDRFMTDEIISHELAHFYMGNIVTMEWWDQVWLKEGFGSFVAMLASDAYIGGNYYYDSLPASVIDTYPSTWLQEDEAVVYPENISLAYSALTYMRGAAVARMFSASFGDSRFQSALSRYLVKFSYQNVKTSDFMAEMAAELPNLNTNQIIPSWIEQKGYPLVLVEYLGQDLAISQRPFSAKLLNMVDGEDGDRNWWVPITFQNGDVEWLPPDRKQHNFPVPDGIRLNEIKINVNQTGYYRVQYPTQTWLRFRELLLENAQHFGARDRAGLIDDVFELAKCGLVSYETTLAFADTMAKETNLHVWDMFYEQLIFLNQMLSASSQLTKFQQWAGGILRQARHELKTLPPTANNKKSLAILAEAIVLLLGEEDARCYAEKYIDKASNLQLPFIELRRAVLAAKMKTENNEAAVSWLRKYESETDVWQVPEEVSYALANADSFHVLKAEYDKILSSELTNPSFFELIHFDSHLGKHREKIWQWANEHFPELSEKFGTDYNFITWTIHLARYFKTEVDLNAFETFARDIAQENFGSEIRSRRVMSEHIRRNIFWQKNYLGSLESALENITFPKTDIEDC